MPNNNQTQNYYHLLGVDKKATLGEIKRAFHQKAIKTHPDKNTDSHAHVQMEMLNEAYEVLSDEKKRSIYDEGLAIKNENDWFALAKQHAFQEENRDFKIAMQSLKKAMQLKAKDKNVDDWIDINLFLSQFKVAPFATILFEEDLRPLLPLLKKNKSIVQMSFGSFFDKKYVNQDFAEYLAETNTLEVLDLSIHWTHDFDLRLSEIEMDFVSYGLQFNTSLKSLALCNQPIGDAGLAILLEGLAQQPYTKVRELNLFCTAISNKGAALLVDFLRKNKSIESINLKYNNISVALLKQIEELTEINKNHNRLYPRPSGKITYPSPLSRHSFLQRLGKRISLGEYFHSTRTIRDWVVIFEKITAPYGKLCFLFVDIDPYQEKKLNFTIALEHHHPLFLQAAYGKGVYLCGPVLTTNQANVDLNVFTRSTNYYLSQEASVIQIEINEILESKTDKLEKKLEESLEQIHCALDDIFNKGIYLNEEMQHCVSWLRDKAGFFEETKTWDGGDCWYDGMFFMASPSI